MDISHFRSVIVFNKKTIKYIGATFLLYLIFLIVNLPASFAVSIINLPPGMSYRAVSGTAWAGKLQHTRYRGVSLGTVSWKLSPVKLLLGELSSDISIVNNEQYINTGLKVSMSGKVSLEETRFSIDLSSLQPLIYGMPFAYEGQASGYFPVSFFLKNEYIGLNGKLSLSGIGMVSPQQQLLGDFVIDFRAENLGATSGKISDNGGPLSINGTLNLSKNGQAVVSAKLASRQAGSALEQALAFFGRKDNNGRVVVNTRFKLWR